MANRGWRGVIFIVHPQEIEKILEEENFSGAVALKRPDGEIHFAASGFADIANGRLNLPDTRFGIASGAKLMTAISAAQLVDAGKLAFSSRLADCVDFQFPHFTPDITIHHLLSHTSGIPDYFDEETMDDFEALWRELPMYHMRRPGDFLPLFQNEKMKFNPGEKFQYNNAGYILLGLVVEAQTGEEFSAYVEENIFKTCGMQDSGYFSMDRLPGNTANSYIFAEDGSWRTNLYSVPVKGGADGGVFVTAPDMLRLWEGLTSHRLLSKETTESLLSAQATVDEKGDYGYGVWLDKLDSGAYKCHIMGYDPGVNFHSAYFPETGNMLAVASNRESGAAKVMQRIENMLSRVK